ncbi:MAG: hypothetical protein H7067_16040 [Burkholderiales bacterium]|nr:hypothetical protein [Opitutaceae bacterium]
MRLRAFTRVAVGFFFALSAALANSELQRTVVAARIDASYVAVQKADGSRGLVPLSSLTPEDKAWLEALAIRNPLVKGKSSVTVVKQEAVIKPKLTIELSKTENGVETVRLCQPNLMRDQIGGTCMFYARVHWLDIAGYYVNTPDIYKVINHCPTDAPWMSPLYLRGLDALFTTPVPQPRVHRLPPEAEPFAWAREQLRKGRPILAAFPREIWQALPPEFVGSRPWSGGSVGHQIVINGFTHNAATDTGDFHIINSWAELGQFDLSLKAAGGGALVIEASLSPKGEVPTAEEAVAAAATIQVRRVTFVRAAGKVNLYEVETNRGVSRVLAATEAAARTMAEEAR